MKNIKQALRKSQNGIILIEAMVAILIFTIGVIALMGVQAVAIRTTSDTKIRMDAEFFVDQLLSEMAIDARATAVGATPNINGEDRIGELNVPRLTARYASASNGPGFQRWRDRLFNAAAGGLPGAEPPTITVTDLSAGGNLTPTATAFRNAARVDVIVLWRGPKDPAAPVPARRVVASAILY